MRKLFFVLICLCILLWGCENNQQDSTHAPLAKQPGTYTLLTMEENTDPVDVQIIDRFLASNAYGFGYYETLKQNVPDILSYLRNVTPDLLKDQCSIYRFSYDTHTGLNGETFLIYEDEVFVLGKAVGCHGVTEFAYIEQESGEKLYFIYSFGSGLHRSHIGAFDFRTKQLTHTDGLLFQRQDITFCLSQDLQTLGVCQAEIRWPNFDAVSIEITPGNILYEDVLELDFK
mgnify:CR=1 FL=1